MVTGMQNFFVYLFTDTKREFFLNDDGKHGTDNLDKLYNKNTENIQYNVVGNGFSYRGIINQLLADHGSSYGN